MANMKTLPGFYTEQEVAEMLGVSIRTLRNNSVRRKGPPRTVVNRHVFYRMKSFDTWLRTQERSFGHQSSRTTPDVDEKRGRL